MGKTQELIDDFLREHPTLEPDERLVAAAKVMPSAKARRQIGMTAGLAGALGTVVSSLDRSSADESLEHPLKYGFFAVVTDRRLMFVSTSAVRARPEKVIGGIPRSNITSVEGGVTRVSLLKLETATITCSDGSSLYFEFAKPQTEEGRELVVALQG